MVLNAYIEQAGTRYLKDLWFLTSLLWVQFGFAAIFHSLLKQKGRHLVALILLAILPPLLLYLIVFSTTF
jgi:hypothetical protein